MTKTIFFITPFMRIGYTEWYKGKSQISDLPVFHRVLTGLVREGWNVHLFVTAINDHDIPHNHMRVIDGVSVHFYHLPFEQLILYFKKYLPNIANIANYLNLLWCLPKIFRHAVRYKPNIYYAICHYSLIAYLCARILGGCNVTRMFGTFLSKYLDKPYKIKFHLAEYLGYKIPSDYLILTDDGTQGDKVADLLKVSRKRLKFWKNGIDYNMYIQNFDKISFRKDNSLPIDKIILISVNRLDGWKRVDRTLKSLHVIKRKNANFLFLVLGDGSEKTRLIDMVNNLGLRNHVRFLGQIPRDQVKEYLNAADIFIANYDVSNLGSSLYEAMVCGKAIVTIDTGETGKVIKDGLNGILVSSNDSYVPGIARALIELINNPEKIALLSNRVRKYALNNFYSFKKRIAMEIKLFNSLIS